MVYLKVFEHSFIGKKNETEKIDRTYHEKHSLTNVCINALDNQY